MCGTVLLVSYKLTELKKHITLHSLYFTSICRVGQNRIYTPYMTVYMVISLPKIPYIHHIYMVLANPKYLGRFDK